MINTSFGKLIKGFSGVKIATRDPFHAQDNLFTFVQFIDSWFPSLLLNLVMCIGQLMEKKKMFSLLRVMFLFVCFQSCVGIAKWQYFPCVKCATRQDSGMIRTITYQKARNDTILRVAFNSPLATGNNVGCNEWYIKFNGNECNLPAPISSSLTTITNQPAHPYHWTLTPAEISGFCSSTSSGTLTPGAVEISVHVRSCRLDSWIGDAHTGPAIFDDGVAPTTSSIVVEEYCVNWFEVFLFIPLSFFPLPVHVWYGLLAPLRPMHQPAFSSPCPFSTF